MARRTGRNYLLYVLAIAVGTTMTHSLVPPTPGPLFAANALKVDLGTMIIAGVILSALAASSGLAYAWWANRRWPIDARAPNEEVAAPAPERPESELPPLWRMTSSTASAGPPANAASVTPRASDREAMNRRNMVLFVIR